MCIRPLLFSLFLLYSFASSAHSSVCIEFLEGRRRSINRYRLSRAVQNRIYEGQISKTEIKEIFTNRIPFLIPEVLSGRLDRFWFISKTNSEKRFMVIMAKNPERWTLIYSHPSTDSQEKVYFRFVTQNPRPRILNLNRKILGTNKLIIEGNVQLELFLKQQISISKIIAAIDSWSDRAPSNDDSQVTNSYKLTGYVDNQPLVIVLEHHKENLKLIDAFLP